MACASLHEVSTPPGLHYIAHRAFFGCEQLLRFVKIDELTRWRGPYAESNTFVLCDKFDEESRKGLH